MSVSYVYCDISSLIPRADILAQSLNLPLAQNATDRICDLATSDYYLAVTREGVCLVHQDVHMHGPICCDFTSAASIHRRKYGGGMGQAIARAVGITGRCKPQVLDVTAGLGSDTFVMASLGCHVVMIERHPIVQALLKDGIERANGAALLDPELAPIVQRLSLHCVDAVAYLSDSSANHRPDVIYLDPMYPERQKSAKVKKQMQAFHTVIGSDSDASELLQLSLKRAVHRVVVKRSLKAPCLKGPAPSYALTGKSTRFDVYALRKLPAVLGVSSDVIA